jgi:hypothetical protein
VKAKVPGAEPSPSPASPSATEPTPESTAPSSPAESAQTATNSSTEQPPPTTPEQRAQTDAAPKKTGFPDLGKLTEDAVKNNTPVAPPNDFKIPSPNDGKSLLDAIKNAAKGGGESS